MILQLNENGKSLKDKISFNNIFSKSNISQGQIDDVWTKWIEYSKQADATTLGFSATLDKTNEGFKEYFTTVDSGTVSKEGLTKAVTSLGGAFDFAAIKATAANVAINALAGVGIALVLKGVTELADFLIVTQDELKDTASTSVEAFETTKSSIQDINSQLDENTAKINELKAKGKLTYVEQAEVNKLEKTNKKLEKQLELQEKLLVAQGYQAAKDTGKVLKGYTLPSSSTVDSMSSVENYMYGFNNGNGDTVETKLKDTTNLQGQIEALNYYNQILETTASSTSEWEDANEKAMEAETNLNNAISNIQTELLNMEYAYDLIADKPYESLNNTEKFIKETYDSYNNALLEMEKVVDPSSYYETVFDNVFSSDTLEDTQDKLIKLAKTGKLKSSTINSYEDLENALKDTDVSAKDLIDSLKNNGLSANELAVQIEALADNPFSSIAGLQNRTDVLAASFKKAKEDVESLATAITESVGASGLSSDSITAIEGIFVGMDNYDPEKLFEETANGIHLNADELAKLNKEYEKTKKEAFEEHLKDLNKEYVETCKEIQNFTGSLKEQDDLIEKRDALKLEIDETQRLKSQYEGLTSAYQKWLNAKATDNEGAMYDAIKDGYDDMKELADNHDWGVDELEEYIRLLTGKDVSTASIEETEKYWKKAQAAKKKYFTKDDNIGLMNFLNDANKKSSGVTKNKNGTWNIDVDTEQLASDMGIGVEAVESIFKKLIDKKWKVNFKDEISAIDELKNEALSLIDEVNDKDFKVSLDAESKKDLQKQLKDLQKQKKDIEKMDIDPKIKTKKLEALNKSIEYTSAKIGEITEVEFSLNIHDNLDQLEKDLDALLDEVGTLTDDEGIEIEIDFSNNDPDYITKEIQGIENALINMQDSNGDIDIETSGAEEAQDILTALISRKYELNHPTIVDIDVSKVSEDLQNTIQDMKDLQEMYQELALLEQEDAIGLPVEAEITSVQESISKAEAEFAKANPTMMTKLGLKEGETEKLKGKIQSLDGNSIVKLGIDASAIEGYTPSEKEIKTTVVLDRSEADKYLKENLDKKANLTVVVTGYQSALTKINKLKKAANVNISTSGTQKAAGSAHAQGSAFARGDWAIKTTSKALVGELGREILVNPRTGTWQTIGDNGAEFRTIPKGSIIFDHLQTEQLLHGKNVSNSLARGSAFASGNAYVKASGSSLTANKTIKSSTKKSSSSGKKKSSSSTKNKSSSSSDDDFLETFDYIEIKIDRIERAIESLDLKAGSTYSSWSSRNKALSSEMSKIKTQIDANTKGYEAYLKKANSLGLSSTYINKIKNGSISLQDITNEDLANKIKDFQDLYEKAIDLKQSTEKLNEQLKELAQQKFDNLAKQYEDILSTFDSKSNALETIIDTQELKGFADSVKYYEELLKTNNSTLTNLEKEKSALISSLNEAVNSGYITKNSEAWYELKQEIDDVQQSIYEAEQAAQEFKNTIEEISWDNFDSLQDKISDIVAESEFLNDLLSNKDLFDDNGNFTTEGQSSMALYGINYNTYMKQADEYAQALKELDEQYKNDSLNTRYLERRQELVETQRDLILNAEEEKQNMIDLKEEGYDVMLDSLDELIEKRKELNDTVRDFYDYEKEIAEKTKEVTNLEKKLSAFSGDTSEESKKTIQELKIELQEAKDDLRETEYDKYISDQEKLLDNIYSETEAWINERLDNADELLQNIIDEVNADSGIISETIREQAENVGYTLSNSMNTILGESGANITSPITNMLSIYNQNFSTQMTSLITAVNNIKTLVGGQEEKANANATSQVKTATTNSSSTASKSTTSASTSTSTKTSSTSSANSSANNIFTYQKFTGNKSKLNYKTSIVD